jgi:hypothetical protein
MGFDWRKFVNTAEKDAARSLKWKRGEEAEKYTKPFYDILGVKTRFPWCAVAIHYWLKESGCEFPLRPDPETSMTFASVQTWKTWARMNGFLVQNKAELLPGDLLIFDWDHSGTVEHIGCFIRNFYETHDLPSGSKLVKMAITAEGNTSQKTHKDGMTAIKKRSYSVIDSVIRLPRGYEFPSSSSVAEAKSSL